MAFIYVLREFIIYEPNDAAKLLLYVRVCLATITCTMETSCIIRWSKSLRCNMEGQAVKIM